MDRERQGLEAVVEDTAASVNGRDLWREATGLPGRTGQEAEDREPPSGHTLWLDRHAAEYVLEWTQSGSLMQL